MHIKIENGITRHPDWRMAEPVNLEILPGEQVAIIGDNAAGKSRLVEILTGHYPLLMNEVQYDFGPGDHRLVSDNLRYISFRDSYGESDGTYYYQQRWNQHDIDEQTPTVADLLRKAPGHGTTQEKKDAVDKLVRLFHLENLLDKYIITLSSGELRKFQLTRALMGEPRALILDNPFIGLDAPTRQQLKDLLEELISRTGLQVILLLSRREEIPAFITHILPVRGLRLMPKQTRQSFLSQAEECPTGLPAEEEEWINSLPQHNITAESFYPKEGGEILNFSHVSIRYGQRTILDDLSWSVHEGEHWALTGQNGSGKSTLLSLVCADNPQAYACDIALFGHRRGSGESIWEIKRHIGYVSPEMHRAYMRDLPAIDIVASGLHDSVGLYQRPRPEQRAVCLGWMRVMGIESLADRTFLRLSSGEQRLCLLARAFVKDPELLILDEPLHGLDEKQRRRVKDIIEVFCSRRHKTLVMVSHYEEELPACIDHRIVLKRQDR